MKPTTFEQFKKAQNIMIYAGLAAMVIALSLIFFLVLTEFVAGFYNTLGDIGAILIGVIGFVSTVTGINYKLDFYDYVDEYQSVKILSSQPDGRRFGIERKKVFRFDHKQHYWEIQARYHTIEDASQVMENIKNKVNNPYSRVILQQQEQ